MTKEVVGCSDHYCKIRWPLKKGGMGTNGGCRCVEEAIRAHNPMSRLTLERALYYRDQEIERLREVVAGKEADCIRLHKQFMDAKYGSSDEPTAREVGKAMYDALARSVIDKILNTDVKIDPADSCDIMQRLHCLIYERDTLRQSAESGAPRGEAGDRAGPRISPHTTEDDFQHFLISSGKRGQPNEQELRPTYYAGADKPVSADTGLCMCAKCRQARQDTEQQLAAVKSTELCQCGLNAAACSESCCSEPDPRFRPAVKSSGG